MQGSEYAVEMIDICKNFGKVQANKDVNLKVKKGEIHAIVGENGAGKTTLMNILYGILEPTSGEIRINGETVRLHSPKKAISLGIGMVHQHFKLVPSFSVAENICLGNEPLNKFKFVNKKEMLRYTREISDKYGLAVDSRMKVRDLSVGLLQRVEILKALSKGAGILILDEPTAVLTPLECKDLFAVLRNMSADGKTVIIITHKLKEVMEISDNITVLSKGVTKGTVATDNTDEKQLAGLMMGKNADYVELDRKTFTDKKVCLEIKELRVRDAFDVEKLKGISLKVKSGEIVTIVGVEGNGQTELVEAMLGFAQIKSGTISVDGMDITRKSVKERRKYCSYIPEDRRKTGLNLKGSVHDNLIAGRHCSRELKNGCFINYRKTGLMSGELIKKYSIKTANQDIEVNSLSGGNQQKIVVARELGFNNNVLVVAQPSRGVDIGATRFIHEQLIQQRNQGCAILLVSTDLDEVFALSDIVKVLYNGEIVATFSPRDISLDEIGLYMTGAKRMEGNA